jgi:hypothetical protein
MRPGGRSAVMAGSIEMQFVHGGHDLIDTESVQRDQVEPADIALHPRFEIRADQPLGAELEEKLCEDSRAQPVEQHHSAP